MELRMQVANFQTNEDGTMKVSGYVNETGKRSNMLGQAKKFVEVIKPGAFTKAINNKKRDIDFLDEHDSKRILASTRNGSLELYEDERGLFMSATIAPTSWGKDTYTLIDSGILKNMSFGFRSLKDSWKRLESNVYERVVEDLELFEVSVVRVPAYSQSSIAARGIDLIEDVEIPDELEKENRDMEQMLEAIKSLEERFSSLLETVNEIRTAQAEAIEQRKQEDEQRKQEAEQRELAEKEAEEQRAKAKEEEEEAEKNKAKTKTDDDVDEDDDVDDDKDEDDDEEEKKQKRSAATESLSEFRSILNAIKQEEKQ